MTQRPESPSSSSRNALIVLVIGGLAVLALVGWALTRSMQAPVTIGTTTYNPAPNPAPAPTTTTPSDAEHAAVPRVTPDELKQKIDRQEVTVIDVRDAEAYTRGHIPGALHIPLSRVEGEIAYLPKAKPIVFYCT